jgi:hypothetical protein
MRYDLFAFVLFVGIAVVEFESVTYFACTAKPRFNVPAFSEIPDLVMIFSCPDNSSI